VTANGSPITLTRELLEEAVLETLRTMASAPEAIAREATLAELDIDSLDLVELTQILEEEQGVVLGSGRKFDDLRTVGDVLDCVVGQGEFRGVSS
jgi:acyl carrier protein